MRDKHGNSLLRILRVGGLSQFIIRHSTVASFGRFPPETSGFMAGPIRQRELLACIVTQRPGALHKMLVYGRNGTPGLDARRRFTLEMFSSSASDLTCIDSICRRKVYDFVENEYAMPRMTATYGSRSSFLGVAVFLL